MFKIRACLVPTHSVPAHHIHYKGQLCHPALNDGMMEAIDRRLQRGCLIRQLPDTVEYIKHTTSRMLQSILSINISALVSAEGKNESH